MDTQNTTTNQNSKQTRRQSYETRVAAFVAANGPEFELQSITFSDAEAVCEACGKKDIHNLYWVKSAKDGKVYCIGCECQTLVLPLVEAHLPASRVRKLDLVGLTKLGAKYGLDVDQLPDTLPLAELAEEVIAARRSFANQAGWSSRREQGKASKKEPAQLVLELAQVTQ